MSVVGCLAWAYVCDALATVLWRRSIKGAEWLLLLNVRLKNSCKSQNNIVSLSKRIRDVKGRKTDCATARTPERLYIQRVKNAFVVVRYKEIEGAGSRVCFATESHKIKLHKPHPADILKAYQVDLIIEELTKKGLI